MIKEGDSLKAMVLEKLAISLNTKTFNIKRFTKTQSRKETNIV